MAFFSGMAKSEKIAYGERRLPVACSTASKSTPYSSSVIAKWMHHTIGMSVSRSLTCASSVVSTSLGYVSIHSKVVSMKKVGIVGDFELPISSIHEARGSNVRETQLSSKERADAGDTISVMRHILDGLAVLDLRHLSGCGQIARLRRLIGGESRHQVKVDRCRLPVLRTSTHTAGSTRGERAERSTMS